MGRKDNCSWYNYRTNELIAKSQWVDDSDDDDDSNNDDSDANTDDTSKVSGIQNDNTNKNNDEDNSNDINSNSKEKTTIECLSPDITRSQQKLGKTELRNLGKQFYTTTSQTAEKTRNTRCNTTPDNTQQYGTRFP